MKFWSTLLLTLIAPIMLMALECSVCNKKIRRQYFRDRQQRVYCSNKCADSLLPKCAHCGKTCSPHVITMQKKNFCSKECMYRVFNCSCCGRGSNSYVTAVNQFGTAVRLCPSCRARPKCCYCSLPCTDPMLPDGRHICRKCRKTAVSDHGKVRRIFNKVRSDLSKLLGYDRSHRIELFVVDARQLNREAKSLYMPANGLRTGLMKYHLHTTVKRTSRGKKTISKKTKCQIFILDNLPEDMLYDVIAHELTHDFLRHKVGKINDQSSEEGFCELAAAIYNQKRGKYYLNRAKSSNTDPVYGNGYRRMRNLYHRSGNNFQRTLKYVK